MTARWGKRLIALGFVVCLGFILRLTWCAPKPVAITAYTVAPGRVEETVTNSKAGTVKARRRAKLSPEMGGRVVYLGAREGQRVKAGDLLLRLEDSEYRASMTHAESAFEAAQASAREACLSAELATKELTRNQELRRQGIVSDSVLDQITNQRDAARARCEALTAEARRAEAAVAVAKANFRRTELRAPFDGMLVELTTEIGEWVSPSPPAVPIPPVADILDAESIYVEAPIDEVDAGRLLAGYPVRIRLDPFPDQSFPGHLIRVAPFVRDIEGQNRTVDVEVELDDKQFARTLLPGTSADIELILQARDKALRVPTHTLLDGDRVLLIEGKKLMARDVKPGLRNWEFVEITSGLKEGDRIAVSLDRAEVKEGALISVSGEARK